MYTVSSVSVRESTWPLLFLYIIPMWSPWAEDAALSSDDQQVFTAGLEVLCCKEEGRTYGRTNGQSSLVNKLTPFCVCCSHCEEERRFKQDSRWRAWLDSGNGRSPGAASLRDLPTLSQVLSQVRGQGCRTQQHNNTSRGTRNDFSYTWIGRRQSIRA